MAEPDKRYRSLSLERDIGGPGGTWYCTGTVAWASRPGNKDMCNDGTGRGDMVSTITET